MVNAYLLTYGGLLLLGGRLGDLLGHRRMFIYGITLFTLSSLACGLSSSQGMLVVARAVQGVGGAVASAVSLSLIMVLFTETGERAKAMGFFGFVASGGGSLGVLLGGVLTDSLSWHWIFLVNVPIGVAVCALCCALLPASAWSARDRPGRRPRRGDRDRRADGRRLRDRQRQRQRLDVVRDARAPGPLGGAHRDLRRRSSRASASRWCPCGLFRLHNLAHGEHRRRPVGGRDVRVVLPRGPVSAAGARLQPARGRPVVPAVEPDHGGVLARPLGAARHALRHPQAARRRARPRLVGLLLFVRAPVDGNFLDRRPARA